MGEAQPWGLVDLGLHLDLPVCRRDGTPELHFSLLNGNDNIYPNGIVERNTFDSLCKPPDPIPGR